MLDYNTLYAYVSSSLVRMTEACAKRTASIFSRSGLARHRCLSAPCENASILQLKTITVSLR